MMNSKARLLDRGFWKEDTRLLLPRLCGDCVMITLISHPALPGNVFGCGQSAVRGRCGPPAAPHKLALHRAGGRHRLLLVPENKESCAGGPTSPSCYLVSRSSSAAASDLTAALSEEGRVSAGSVLAGRWHAGSR